MKKLFLNDNFILILILLNALLIFFQCCREQSRLLLFIDFLFLAFFLVEMYVKISTFGWKRYWKNPWHRFDGIVTLLSSLSLLQLCTFLGTQISLEFLIVLRIFRIFRFFRILRFIPSIESLISGTKRAILSTYIILLAFLVISFIVSLVSCSIFRHISPEYFGNPTRSFYSIFQLFTVEGWYEIPNTISSECENPFFSAAVKVYFVFLLFAGGIIGMSFINSIIVDAMVLDNNDSLVEKIESLERKIDRLTDRLAGQKADSQENSQANSQANSEANSVVNSEANSQTNFQTDSRTSFPTEE